MTNQELCSANRIGILFTAAASGDWRLVDRIVEVMEAKSREERFTNIQDDAAGDAELAGAR